MTKTQALKKLQGTRSSLALGTTHATDFLPPAIDKPMRNIRYLDQEIINLKKDLKRSRFLIHSVKIGRGYFSMLKEENALKKQRQQLEKIKQEELHRFQPAKKSSDLPYGDLFLGAYFDEKTKRVKGSIPRPFTPMYSCIVSPFLPESHVEPLFRQLCALHWLLEALTIDHSHHTMKPVMTCWNLKDPGGSKNTVKKINKDKSMGQKWENFITAPKTKKFKLPGIRTTCRKPSRRGSMISLSRTSGGSSPQSSMVSVNPAASDEHPSIIAQGKDIDDNESSSTKLEEENLHLNLQKLLELVREDAHRSVTIEAELPKKFPSITALLKQTKSDSNNKDKQSILKSRSHMEGEGKRFFQRSHLQGSGKLVGIQTQGPVCPCITTSERSSSTSADSHSQQRRGKR